jgi:hypothetical protein
VATRPVTGKPTLVKKTPVDRFNESRQEESRRLNSKRKMEHDEKMASISLKKHKYDLRYGTGSIPQTPGSSTAALATRTQAAAMSKEDKQIQILHLQIRLAELTRDNSESQAAQASSSRSRAVEGMSTPSSGISGMSSISFPGHGGFVDDNFMISEDPGHYRHQSHDIPDGEAGWPETYNFS